MDDELIRMAAFNWLKEQVEIHGEVLSILDKVGHSFRSKVGQ